MLKHTLFITGMMISSWAVSLDEIIQQALLRNNDIKSLQYSIKMTNEQIKLASKWQNPTLSLGVNDIQFDNVNRRNLEPMQGQYVGFSQILPLGDKLETQEQIASYDKQIATYELNNQKRILKSRVYELGYTIIILEKKLQYLNKYQRNLEKLEQLLNGLYENGKIKQADILNVKVNISNFQIQKINMQNQIKTLYLKLEQISYLSVSSIEKSLSIEEKVTSLDIKNHPKINILKTSIEKQRSLVRLEMQKKFSDIKINVTYFQRDSKYEDYGNISVNIPLSVYNKEEIKSFKARLKEKAMRHDLKTLEQGFKTQYHILQEQLLSAKKNHRILQEYILPLKRTVQDAMESYNSVNQIRPEQIIKTLNDVITYELKALNEIENYFKAHSQQRYYTQGN